MRAEDLDRLCLGPEASIHEALERLTAEGMRIVIVVDGDRRLLGVVTDGDVRRHILANGLLSAPVTDCYNPRPHTVAPGTPREEIQAEMTRRHLTALPEVDGSGRLLAVHRWDDTGEQAGGPSKTVGELSVVVMAGGAGTRLDPLTRILPKALVPVGDRPILERIFEQFSRVGVESFDVLVHHKGEMVRVYFESLPELPYQVRFHVESSPLGTIGGLGMIDAASLERDILVSNCDILLDLDWRELVDFHRAEGADLTLVGAAHRVEIPYGVLRLGEDGQLAELEEKPRLDYLVNTGLYLLRRETLERLAPGQSADAPDLIRDLLAGGGRVRVFPVAAESWLDIGNWRELDRTRGRLGGKR